MERTAIPKRRIFIYGLQSSGASLFAYFLAQQPDTVAVLDLLVPHVAPPLQVAAGAIVKATICPAVDLHLHLDSFRPDCRLLFLRHPQHNYASLNCKPYRDDGGPIDDKFARLEQVFRERERWFDATICYETFLADPDDTAVSLRQLGISIPLDAAQFKRPLANIISRNQEWSWWCRQYFGERWHVGNIHGGKLKLPHPIYYPKGEESDGHHMGRLCPSLAAFYQQLST